jgi:hypothetical protein
MSVLTFSIAAEVATKNVPMYATSQIADGEKSFIFKQLSHKKERLFLFWTKNYSV